MIGTSCARWASSAAPSGNWTQVSHVTGGYTDHYTNRARVLIILFDDRLAAPQNVGYITYKFEIDNSNKILHWATYHMVSRLLFQLALVIVIPCFAAQSALKSDNTSVWPGLNRFIFNLFSPNMNVIQPMQNWHCLALLNNLEVCIYQLEKW